MYKRQTPFGAPAPEKGTPKKTKKKSVSSQSGAEPVVASSPKVKIDPVPAVPEPTTKEAEHEFAQESSSMVEGDETTDSDERYTSPKTERHVPVVSGSRTVEASDSGFDDFERSDDEIKLTPQPVEPEATGYDLSLIHI